MIGYGKLGLYMIFLLIDFRTFSCHVSISTLMKVFFCGREDFFQAVDRTIEVRRYQHELAQAVQNKSHRYTCYHTIPKKRNRFGIKLFVLCDCTTCYILQFVVYTGNKNPSPDILKKLAV